ncbi:MAG: ABC transporter permease, partial [Vallitaleaceae bacterium]|nr:ABC transporter permease [Vallitaleaceae bacterium]
IDPLLFFISTLFIVGMSLLLLRVYPFLVRLFFKVGEKFWHPVAYFSLVNVGKADKNLQAIMLFLILSISFGLVNANQARTINMNTADRVAYQQGSDVVIEPYNNLKHIGTPPPGMEVVMAEIPYMEPPFHQYKELEGVEKITKVYHEKEVRMNGAGGRILGAQVYGITTNEFGEVAWFREDILNHHLNEYLNLIAGAPKAVLLSSNIRDEFGIEVGDTVSVTMEELGTLECTVYAFIEFFPSYMPYDTDGRKNYFAVVNAAYIEDQLPLHPYEIWIKKDAGVSDAQINQSLIDQGLQVESIRFMNQEMVRKKNDPMLLGTNGSLTMSFIIEMLITAIGFILFWVLSIRERSLKFGIFRAIGMPMRDVGLIMLLEQLLVSGVAIAMGFLLGGISSKLFIPLLEVVYSSSQQVPKFKVIANQEDYMKVLWVTIFMVMSCLIVLHRQIRQSNVNQVIKLGEDS